MTLAPSARNSAPVNARIIFATTDLLRVEQSGPAELARALGVGAPLQWPPEFGGFRYLESLIELWRVIRILGASAAAA
jgi:hypothetical protein